MEFIYFGIIAALTLILHQIMWQGYSDGSLIFILIPGAIALAILGVFAWLYEKSKILSYIYAAVVAIALINWYPENTKTTAEDYNGPCAHVAPEDYMDCMELESVDYDPAAKYNYSDEPLGEPVDPYEFSVPGGCPYGCDFHKDGCDIKGNISFSTGEKIYHVPGGEFYPATEINPAYSESWFCTEEEAITNGFRRSHK